MLQKFINGLILGDNKISSVRVMAEFDVGSTGTLSNYEFRTDIGLIGVYNFKDIQELESKYLSTL